MKETTGWNRFTQFIEALHGRLGLHGFASDRIYWRVDAGFLGAGPGGITTGAALGYRFGGGTL